jgi:hypothetical protein
MVACAKILKKYDKVVHFISNLMLKEYVTLDCILLMDLPTPWIQVGKSGLYNVDC